MKPTVLIVIARGVRFGGVDRLAEPLTISYAEQLARMFPTAVADLSGGAVLPTVHHRTVPLFDIDGEIRREDTYPAAYYREVDGEWRPRGYWLDPGFGHGLLWRLRIDSTLYDHVLVVTDRDTFAPEGGIYGITSGRWSHVFPSVYAASAVAHNHTFMGYYEHEFIHQLEAAIRDVGLTPPDLHAIIQQVGGNDIAAELRAWFAGANSQLALLRDRRPPRPPRGAAVYLPQTVPYPELWTGWNPPAWTPPDPGPRPGRPTR